ncbi:MAG: endolytic transglycosylase MltG [Dehalococcoidia bacterium]|nr:endolytic transglycosylase MltG [Dehalococcoidia bacterium]
MVTGNNFISSALVGLALAALLGGAAYVIASSPASVPRNGLRLAHAADAEPVFIMVEAGDNAAAIGQRLEAAQIIDSASSFQRLAKITGAERNLAAGEYEFVPGTATLDAVMRIRDGLTSARIVAVPEGMRLEEIGNLLERRGVVKAGDFLQAVNAIATQGTAIDADLLSSRPKAATLEGYTYPATYSFSRSVSPNEVVLTMMETLSDRLTPELRAEARAQGLTVHEVLILASIVEREVVLPEERPLIAAVYRNRLKIDMPLQADPTVQYAIAARPGNIVEFGYWKRALSLQDLQFDSTYNTYTKRGLPPGPIANPGIDSIIAVIRPAPTKHLFFVARNDGSHAFSETFAEHQSFVEQYQP